MIDIYLSAEGQSLSVRSKPDRLVAGSKGMLRLRFGFDSAWNGFKACADFGAEAAPIIDGACIVPDSVSAARVINVRVVGERDGARMLTGSVKIRQEAR